ncbi:90_t:CDS:2 [Gigaspora margarita]|uniref:90_t:CDS:1 n=1 Tax=Gigaspora margarita TaxID=4874 RepID=A0ABN7UQ46_GIGMA|nr:90_t:CDS:2 [Gigaspora margarita]
MLNECVNGKPKNVPSIESIARSPYLNKGVPDGLYLSIDDLPNLTQIIKNYHLYPFSESLTPQIAVITDSFRILGLDDLAGARIDPRRTLLIIIDLGTDNEKNLNDKFYLDIHKKRVSNDEDIHPTKHRILFFSAGSASIGVAKQLLEFFKIEYGMSEKEAKKLVWLVDTKGLVTCNRGDELASHKVYFTYFDNKGRQYKSLIDVIKYIKPTALIGLSFTGGEFDKTVLKKINSMVKKNLQELLSQSGEKWQALVKYVKERIWDPNHEDAFPTESLIEKSKF